MKTLNYSIRISAPKERVWNDMLDLERYRRWARAFSQNSQFDGEWREGAYIKFIDPDMGGTKAILEQVTHLERIQARHVAIINRDGSEDTDSDVAKKWAGITETYSLSEAKGVTDLSVEIRTHEDFEEMFNDGWPKALGLLKEMCEEA